jgi:hypothetical protein
MGLLCQLWLLWIESSLGFQEVRLDVEGAFATWRGEDTIWLLPELTGVVRWVRQYAPDGWSPQLAIPSRRLNVIDVFHVWENGLVWGPGSKLRFPESRVDGLLREWLNAWGDGRVSLCDPLASVTIEIPRIRAQGKINSITFEEMTLFVQSGSSLPAGQSGDEVVAEWPIRGSRLLSVFPDAESHEGPQHLPKLPSCLRAIQWPPLLAPLFPVTGGGLDELVGQRKMVELARRSQENRETALWEALQTANPYITQGFTTQMRASVWPAWVEEGVDGALDIIVNRFGLQCRSWEDVMQSLEGQSILTQTVPVRRAWGVLGLFWMLLIDQLKRGRIPHCDRCGRILQGKRRFCGPEDDEPCYRGRKRDSRREERAVKDKKTGPSKV